MIALVLITPPAVEPLTADEVRARLGLDDTVEDAQLDALIKAAREGIDGADGWLGRALITQTWEMLLDYFPACGIVIPLAPLQAVVSVKYDDGAGVEQTLDPSRYRVIAGTPAAIRPVTCWPSSKAWEQAVRIQFRAGYGDLGTDVPEPIRQSLVEEVSLARMTSVDDPSLRSKSVDGVGTLTYSTGQDYTETLRRSIDARLRLYRVDCAGGPSS